MAAEPKDRNTFQEHGRKGKSPRNEASLLSSIADSRVSSDEARERSRGRSIRSVGSQQSWTATHAWINQPSNRETSFRDDMTFNYGALDTQSRSDAATVCSGSVLEDSEVESIQSLEEKLCRESNSISAASSRRSTSGNRTVEFASVPLQQNEMPTIPGKNGTHDSTEISNEQAGTVVPQIMGPPLSRAWSLSKQEAEHAHNTKPLQDDCGESVDTESRSSHSNEDIALPSSASAQANELLISDAKATHGRAESVKSYGSYGGSDCGGSLDVETQSLETRSIHSQDDGHLAEVAESVALTTTAPASPEEHSDEMFGEGGRRSPGGTIYKGRGSRRYHGRYMHLTLKRFHEGGVHLDTADPTAPPAVTGEKAVVVTRSSPLEASGGNGLQGECSYHQSDVESLSVENYRPAKLPRIARSDRNRVRSGCAVPTRSDNYRDAEAER